MDTIRDEALDTIIRTKARDMYRNEFLMMAVELKELRRKLGAPDMPIPEDFQNWTPTERENFGRSMVHFFFGIEPGRSREIFDGKGAVWDVTRRRA